jgi:hypothetical protein
MTRRLTILLACLTLSAALATGAAADPSEYAIKTFTASQTTGQAGAHPDLSLDFELETEAGGQLPATTRDIAIDLPPGLLGNPNAVPKCSTAQLMTTDVEDKSNATGCAQAAQVGITEVLLFKNGSLNGFTEPVFNMQPPEGVVARIGFIADSFPIVLNLALRSEGDYGVTVQAEGAGSLIPLLSAKTTTWGVPAAESHDTQRITPYEALHNGGAPETPSGKRSSGLLPAPFLINPTRCGVPRTLTMTAVSYALPDQPVSATASLPPISGCGQLDFEPKFSLTPENTEAAMPTGLQALLSMSQDETPEGNATSDLRYARVTLPLGMRIAPGGGNGLAACSAAQVGLGTREAAACPQAAKIGTAEVVSPSLSRTLQGAVYQRTPVKGNQFGVWLVTDELGVHLKLPGEVHLDEASGQISTSFAGTPQTEGIPQAPVSEFKLRFFGGSGAPLANPRRCGTYMTHYEFTPWSGGAPVIDDTPMTVDRNCDTGGFSPKLSGGAVNPVAGGFSTFVTDLRRETPENEIAQISVALPPGLAAKVAGVPLCEGADAVSANCPAGSRIGTTTIASGPGPDPIWLPQHGKEPTAVFLSGTYKGAPYSLVVRTPVQAGPFDLGTVVTRAAIRIDPRTAQATVSTDPLPHFLEGVPSSLREVQVTIDRPSFALNPTNCDPEEMSGTATSYEGQSAPLSSTFRVGGCNRLGFKPSLSLQLKGKKTSRGGHPALRAVLKSRRGDANIGRIQAALPHSEFIDQAHFQTICTRVQFAADHCPAGSVYGHVTAYSPILDYPVQGPVYLRSSSHELPDLVAVVRGPDAHPIEVNAVGRVDSVNGGIRTTFTTIPDVPLTKAVLEMQGGKKGLFVNSRNICRFPGRAKVDFGAHNGRKLTLHPLLKADCG